MSKTLIEIAQQLKDSNRKVQLIYAFNGTGKTRLSREFKELIAPKSDENEAEEDSRTKVLYYNAFTEDLFYWDNDLESDTERKLKIQPNAYTQWVLQEQGQDQNTIAHFQRYTSDKLTPHFSSDFSEVTFSYKRGNEENTGNIKISKGEESNFIWCIFYSLIEQVIETLNIPESDARETDVYDELEYVFIDDPVSSLDEKHLIRLAVDIAGLIKSSHFYDLKGLRFIITTHNPLFFNVLCNEFSRDDKETGWKAKQFSKYTLSKFEDGALALKDQTTDSPFSYHLFLNDELNKAIETGQIHKYHFNFLRNILEKTSTFLGYKHWEELLPTTSDGTPSAYSKRIVNLGSHSKHAGDEIRDLDEDDKRVLKFLVDNINQQNRFHFMRKAAPAIEQTENTP